MAIEKTAKTKTKKDQETFDWKESVLGMSFGFITTFADSLAEGIRHKVEHIVTEIQKNLVGSFLLAAGMIFCLFGMAVFLNEIFGLDRGSSYAIVGIFSMLFGLIIIKK